MKLKNTIPLCNTKVDSSQKEIHDKHHNKYCVSRQLLFTFDLTVLKEVTSKLCRKQSPAYDIQQGIKVIIREGETVFADPINAKIRKEKPSGGLEGGKY